MFINVRYGQNILKEALNENKYNYSVIDVAALAQDGEPYEEIEELEKNQKEDGKRWTEPQCRLLLVEYSKYDEILEQRKIMEDDAFVLLL